MRKAEEGAKRTGNDVCERFHMKRVKTKEFQTIRETREEE